MHPRVRRFLACFLSVLVVGDAGALVPPAPPQAAAPSAAPTLATEAAKSYLEIFQAAPELRFSAADFERARAALEQGRKTCVTRFQARAKDYDKQIAASRNELKRRTSTLDDAARHALHCQIQNLTLLKEESRVLANDAIPTAYENRLAKVAILQNWPAEYVKTRAQIADGSYHQRRWGDIKDIGIREIAKNQQDDIKTGQDAVREMKATGLMPKAIEDPAVAGYVNRVAQDVARHSDLKIPLHVTVLDSKEINAFALPGGYLFVERGLLDAADNENELAGVIAHEIAHDAARHGHQLMRKATIASIFAQAAQIAAVVLTGGVAGVGTAYALQYGFYGLGLVLSLQLLGVSRDFELQADQLGIQYAWNSGYNPNGFIRFFDKMATREGYVNGVGWFRTHPPFYARMIAAQREIMMLPPRPHSVEQTSQFESMKAALKRIEAEAAKEEAGRPSLLQVETGCAPPQKAEYKPGQLIENLCAAPSSR